MGRTRAPIVSRRDYDAVLFDLDGVLTRTAALHAAAWKEALDEFLGKRRGGGDLSPFDVQEDYRRYVDGKPRYEGAKSFLSSRGIEAPFGDPRDAPDGETVCALGNRKNELFHERLRREGVEVFEGSIGFVERLRRSGFRTAVVTSSKNGGLVLDAAALARLFDVVLDGVDAEALDLRGKPEPDVFLEAARRLGALPERAVAIEDALSGLEAARGGGFGLSIGVERTGEAAARESLERAGADLVVSDLSQVDVVASIDDLPPALDVLEAIGRRLPEKELVVFLDYDGTLAPIVSRPEDAVLSGGMREAVARLARQVSVAVVSGRGLSDLRERVGLEGLVYAGSHGFEIEGPGGLALELAEAKEALADLDLAERELGAAVLRFRGAILERKRFSLAIHYRNLREEEVPGLEEEVDRVLSLAKRLRKTHGKKVFDLQPDVEWNKGRALLWILERLDFAPEAVLPVYVGDDLTDEDAFDALTARGIGVVVGEGERRTAAHFRVPDPDGVRRLLEDLARLVEETSAWRLSYAGFDPEEEGLREALCTLGNGYFATRGAAAESRADGVHYPGTYVAGGYNRARSALHGRTIENEDLVNQPNWLCLGFRVDGGDWFDLSSVEVLSYRQELDLRGGLLRREVRFRDREGRTTRLVERRLVSMDDMHLAGLETTLTPLDWSGRVELRAALDGRVTNSGVVRYRELSGRHLEPVEGWIEAEDVLLLSSRTSQSRLTVAEAARIELFRNGRPVRVERQSEETGSYVAQSFELELEKADRARVEKTVALFTSRDSAVSECREEAVRAVGNAPRFERLLHSHRLAWRHLWRRFEIALDPRSAEEDHDVLRILRLYSFHVLQTLSAHSLEIDAGVPARGWHGEAYRGHVFWDEVIVFPVLNFRMPEITRALLLYRYRRLPEARRAALELGYKGALYPWQSGSSGREESQKIHLNPRSGRWIPDHTHLQRHVNAAIAYNVWQYFQVTGDLEFLSAYGAEMILEIARFWASLATYDRKLGRYEIRGVMGPDEYHDAYPGAERPGVHNNTYTNVMAVFVLNRALELFRILPAPECERLCQKLGIGDSETARWDDIRRKMRVVFHHDGVLSQFEGYEGLEELDWDGYRERYRNIQRLDRILEAEEDTANRYKASKQADVLMLFYLFSADELREIFGQLGYPFERDTIPRTIDYYLKRTSNGSSLSRIIHSWVASRQDRRRSWELFREASKTDAADIQGGTTREGIHLGAMAGTVDLVQRCYTGLEARGPVLRFNPSLPEEVARIHLHLLYRGHWLEIDVAPDRMRIASPASGAEPVLVEVKEERFEVREGMVREVEI